MYRSPGSRYRLLTVLGIIAVACTACTATSDGGTTEPPPQTAPAPWGSEAVAYFDQLAAMYRANDTYGVLDFYSPEARIEKWRGDNRGGSAVQDLLQWNSGDLGVVVVSVLLGDDAVNLVRWTNSGDLGAVVSRMTDGRVQAETAFDLAVSLGASLRASPDVLARYDDLYHAYASAWSSSDPEAIRLLYADGARVSDPTLGASGQSIGDVVSSGSSAIWQELDPSDLFAGDGPAEGLAVFLGPSEYGRDPQQAIGVFEVVDDGCRHLVAVRWELEGGLIVDESRHHDAATFPACAKGATPDGWWTGLELPGPADQVETGAVETTDGVRISVRNGTDRLEDLLAWGLGRFAEAGLSEPSVDTVTFQPSRSCVGRSGRVVDDGTTRNLFVCMYDSDICTRLAPCDVPATRARLAVLHELSHAWMIDNVDADTEERLVDLSGRVAWDRTDLPWIDLGVEYAADTIAWGLMDEDLAMVRMGSPSCARLTEAFSLLTGAAPVLRSPSCGA